MWRTSLKLGGRNLTNATLVIGASGFLGSNILKALSREQMYALGASRNPTSALQQKLVLDDQNWLNNLLAKHQFTNVVFAIGGTSGSSHKAMQLEAWESFKSGVIEAQEALSNCKKVIYLGSAAEYGRSTSPVDENAATAPVDVYGQSKVLETSFMSSLAKIGVSITVVRPSSVYGPRQSGSMLIPSALRAAASGQRLDVMHPSAVRDYLYVEDLADAFVKMVKSDISLAPVINLSSGHEVTIKEIADRVESALNLQGKLFTFPAEHADLGEHDIVRINSTLARTCLAWEPKVSLDEGVPLAVKP